MSNENDFPVDKVDIQPIWRILMGKRWLFNRAITYLTLNELDNVQVIVLEFTVTPLKTGE